MSRKQEPEPPRRRARAALASYLRLLAACLEDEADMIENDPERSEDVLRRFREGVLTLSLDDVPLEALLDGAADGAPMMLSGTAETARPAAAAKRRR
jgi:hypothetical protein